ncbi:hypothetical protein COU57_00800 [Candidatus Pacearchaeota archaeon CG10_big_fil_rev_8_21_14_0_10_32_14]|nr:MAG: hypothetical protein COU57_00800 [Candidatus Pacearchaeota archaeon CG10_big_fil_rev_8_21_14_0_10_32_14]
MKKKARISKIKKGKNSTNSKEIKEKAQISHEVRSDDIMDSKSSGSISQKKSDDKFEVNNKLVDLWLSSSRVTLTPSLDQIAVASPTPIGNLGALRNLNQSGGINGDYIDKDNKYTGGDYVDKEKSTRRREGMGELNVAPPQRNTPSDFIQSNISTRRGITIKTDLDFIDTPKTDYTSKYEGDLGAGVEKKRMPFDKQRKEYD